MTNAFTKFKGLIGTPDLDIVDITVINGDGTSQATTFSGDSITVKGDSVSVGQKAFIRNSEIIRQAPNHTITQVSI